MEQRNLKIGRWKVEFYFAVEGYDADVLLDRMFDFGAGAHSMRQAMELMESDKLNTGFTFSNPLERVAIIAIGPTSSAEEFLNTMTHEIHHLAVAIASSLGVDLESETPAYLAGDSAMALAELICSLGCSHCR